MNRAGFEAHLFDVESDKDDGALSELIRALAVAGFASSNIMLLSVSIWSGAEAETRDLFHWLSLIIALPALAYSGRIFFRSGWRALRHGRTNMDVPISLGVLQEGAERHPPAARCNDDVAALREEIRRMVLEELRHALGQQARK